MSELSLEGKLKQTLSDTQKVAADFENKYLAAVAELRVAKDTAGKAEAEVERLAGELAAASARKSADQERVAWAATVEDKLRAAEERVKDLEADLSESQSAHADAEEAAAAATASAVAAQEELAAVKDQAAKDADELAQAKAILAAHKTISAA